jgi:hypothetical protein
MHLPCAAFAGVDTVDTTVPARNRVAAAAASVAPDLEFSFMTISSIIVGRQDAVKMLRSSAAAPTTRGRVNVNPVAKAPERQAAAI